MPVSFDRIYALLGLGRAGADLARLALGLAAEAALPLRRAAVLGYSTGPAALILAEAGIATLGLNFVPGCSTAQGSTAHQSAAKPAVYPRRIGARHPARWRTPLRRTRSIGYRLAASGYVQAVLAAPPGFRGACDLALMGDLVGRLSDEQALAAAFATAAALLRPGGLLVFAAVEPATMENWEQYDSVLRDDPDYLAFRSDRYDHEAEQLSRRIVWFVRKRATWWRGEAAWHEYPWGDAAIAQALSQAGFGTLQRLVPGNRQAPGNGQQATGNSTAPGNGQAPGNSTAPAGEMQALYPGRAGEAPEASALRDKIIYSAERR